jgi:hypothetical protein
MKHLASIIVFGTFATVTLADVNLLVKISVGVITLIYYSRKWYLMEKKNE